MIELKLWAVNNTDGDRNFWVKNFVVEGKSLEGFTYVGQIQSNESDYLQTWLSVESFSGQKSVSFNIEIDDDNDVELYNSQIVNCIVDFDSETFRLINIEEYCDERECDLVDSDVSAEFKEALGRAIDYINSQAFSRDGLVHQLEYSGYSNNVACYAADNCGVDWFEQAAKKAKEYLALQAFSYGGLIHQLEYSQFTHEQAVYGADAVFGK